MIRMGPSENELEYKLDNEGIQMLQVHLLSSSFRRVISKAVTYPVDTEHYTILIDWNNQKDFLAIHCVGNKYISIADQFDGKNSKVKNPSWEHFLKRIISISKPN